MIFRCLPLRNGALWAEYESVFRREPVHKEDKEVGGKEAAFNPVKQPLLVYPPAALDPPPVDVFAFFHGHRADYRVSTLTAGHENVALESNLQEAVAGTDRVGIAPQAPMTRVWSGQKGRWVPTWDWNEALSKTNHFDGLVKQGLEVLQTALHLGTPFEPRAIHVAGHSGGGVGVGEATERQGGAKLFADRVQDVTLQDAGYGFGSAWVNLLDWFLYGSPGKTVRILISHAEGGSAQAPGATRSILASPFNVKRINETIARDKQAGTLEAVAVPTPNPQDQKPRQGGFILESQLEVRNKKTGGIQGTLVVFFAPGGGHYEAAYASMGAASAAGPQTVRDFLGEARLGVQYRVVARRGTKVYANVDHPRETGKEPVLPLHTRVTVTEVKRGKQAFGAETITSDQARIKDDKGSELGWTPLAALAIPSQPKVP